MGGPSYATVQSDADGNYRLADVPPGLGTLEISTSWLADPEWTSIDLPAGARVPHDVALKEGATIFGTVSDARTGAPVADAEIGAGWTYSRPVRTSATGEYELRGFGGGGVNEIFVRARGYADARHEFPWTRMPIERTQVDLALDPAHRARGRVVDPAGQPIEGVYVAGVSAGGASGTSDWKGTSTDADGRFVIESLHPTHQHGLFLRATGWANLAYAFPNAEHEIETSISARSRSSTPLRLPESSSTNRVRSWRMSRSRCGARTRIPASCSAASTGRAYRTISNHAPCGPTLPAVFSSAISLRATTGRPFRDEPAPLRGSRP
jgi:hypothetical protein